MFRRDSVQAVIESPGIADGGSIEPSQGLVLGELQTHPEFSRIPDANLPTDLTAGVLRSDKLDLLREVVTWPPALAPVIGSGGGTGPDRWYAVTPCGALSLDPSLPVFTDPTNPGPLGHHPGWAPPGAFGAYYGHALIQVFDAQDPSRFQGETQDTWWIIGPDAGGAALDVEVADFEGKTWAFVVDHGGRLLVYDLLSLVGSQPGTIHIGVEYERYGERTCLSDDLPCNAFSVVVDPVSWIDDQSVARDELYVYVSLRRIGIQVLRFVPGAPLGQRLEEVELIQTAGLVSGLYIRDDGSGARDLVVADAQGGARVYGYGF